MSDALWRIPIEMEVDGLKLLFRWPTFDEGVAVGSFRVAMFKDKDAETIDFATRQTRWRDMVAACLLNVNGGVIPNEEFLASASCYDNLSAMIDRVFFRGTLGIEGKDPRGSSGPSTRPDDETGGGEPEV